MAPRSNLIIRALSRPTTLGGVREECWWITGILGVAVIVISKDWTIWHRIFGIGITLFVGYCFGAWFTEQDRQYIPVMLRALFAKKVYDPFLRPTTKVRIK